MNFKDPNFSDRLASASRAKTVRSICSVTPPVRFFPLPA